MATSNHINNAVTPRHIFESGSRKDRVKLPLREGLLVQSDDRPKAEKKIANPITMTTKRRIHRPLVRAKIVDGPLGTLDTSRQFLRGPGRKESVGRGGTAHCTGREGALPRHALRGERARIAWRGVRPHALHGERKSIALAMHCTGRDCALHREMGSHALHGERPCIARGEGHALHGERPGIARGNSK